MSSGNCWCMSFAWLSLRHPVIVRGKNKLALCALSCMVMRTTPALPHNIAGGKSSPRCTLPSLQQCTKFGYSHRDNRTASLLIVVQTSTVRGKLSILRCVFFVFYGAFNYQSFPSLPRLSLVGLLPGL